MIKLKNSTGFSAVEALLILIVISILGFTGWFVYNSQKAANKDYGSQQNTQANTAGVSKPTTSYAGWQTYSLVSEGATIKYPPNWKLSAGYFPGDNGSPKDGPTFVTIASPTTTSVQATEPIDGARNVTGNMIVHIGYDGLTRAQGGVNYMVKTIPVIIPGYAGLQVIEDGCFKPDCVVEMGLTDVVRHVGKYNSADTADFTSKQNSGQDVVVTAGVFHQGVAQGGFVDMAPKAFEGLQDYDTALNILKSLSYSH